MPSYLLDTHILYRWFESSVHLSRAQRRVLAEADRSDSLVAISTITLCELTQLALAGGIRIPVPLHAWLEEVERDPRIEILPLTAAIAADIANLGAGFPADPADRIIACTARQHGLKLLTSDQRIRASGTVAVI